jgi:hypothetical protein
MTPSASPPRFAASLVEPALRKMSRLGASLAGSLIHEVHRRRRRAPLRTPGKLLLEDASGYPGPALVEPIADWDMLLLPSEIDRDQVKDLARAAGKAMLNGGVERMLEIVRDLPRTVPGAIRADFWRQPLCPRPDRASTAVELPAERLAWDRFLAAYDAVEERRGAYLACPDDLTGEALRLAEIELEDAVAMAGEFEVHNVRWILA